MNLFIEPMLQPDNVFTFLLFFFLFLHFCCFSRRKGGRDPTTEGIASHVCCRLVVRCIVIIIIHNDNDDYGDHDHDVAMVMIMMVAMVMMPMLWNQRPLSS